MPVKLYIFEKLKQVFFAFERMLDRTAIAANWQRIKWCTKYLLGWKKYVPSFEALKSRPHRQFLLNEIKQLKNIESALEVGCGRGTNLYLLALNNSHVRLFGTDISEKAVRQAVSEFRELGVAARFIVSKAESLKGFGDNSIDVVISDAVLMYLPPKQVNLAISEMLRVAKVGIVISAWHQDINNSAQLWTYDEGAWIYDYNKLIWSLCNIKTVITPYPQSIWNDRRWKAYGALIRVHV